MLTWQEAAKVANVAAAEQGEWAGAPLPIDSYPMVVAPSYGFQKLNGMYWNRPDDPNPDLMAAINAVVGSPIHVNSWWCAKRGGYVHVFRNKDGRAEHYIDNEYAKRSSHTLTRSFAAFEAAQVQDHEAELMAMDKLKSLIAPHMYNGYVLHGMFLESSPRSGVTYILRKGRPTIALLADGDDGMRIMCCLCMHPIGYYSGTYSGVMVGTDEVISHLILIRSREHFFWRKANQHPAWAWEAGL